MNVGSPLFPEKENTLPLAKEKPPTSEKLTSMVQDVTKQEAPVQRTWQLGKRTVTKAEAPVDYTTVRLTQAELDALQPKVIGEISRLLGEDGPMAETPCLTKEKIEIFASEKSQLHPLESAVLSFYTAAGFKVMNGCFGHDKSVRDFMELRKIPETQFSAVKNAGLLLAKIGASALNKLPPAREKVLYRGSALSPENLAKMVPGTVVSVNRFSSTSLQEGIAGSFAAKNVMLAGGLEVIYVIENQTRAKDIDAYSILKERERIYAPQQKFEVVRIERSEHRERTRIEEEDEIEEARRDGALKQETVTKEKTHYFVKTTSADGDFFEEIKNQEQIAKAKRENTLVTTTETVTKVHHYREDKNTYHVINIVIKETT